MAINLNKNGKYDLKQKQANFRTSSLINANYKNRFNNHMTTEDRIRLRAFHLWQESLSYHESEYYWKQAENQIKVEESKDVYKWYSPKKWLFVADKKCLKPFLQCLNKITFLSILEKIAVLTVITGLITFWWEENQRRNEFIIENWRILAEASQAAQSKSLLSPAQNTVVGASLEQLNREYPGITPLFAKIPYTDVPFLNLGGAWKLVESTWKREKTYYHNGKNNICEEKLKIQLFYPRWDRVSLANIKLPENIQLDEIGLCNADLSGATLNNITLNRALLAQAELFEATLVKTELKDSDLRKSSLILADLSGADLSGADLSGANLSKANLKGADLSGANLSKANLKGADLSGANLLKANLKGANLAGVGFTKISNSNTTSSQLKLACNWDKAFYVYHQEANNEWKLDLEANKHYFYHLKQDKASDPQVSVDCSQWN
ncbi:MAG: pentapeptide repeat-containing protein [Cyanobacteria bacterium P01_G01_bin.19]